MILQSSPLNGVKCGERLLSNKSQNDMSFLILWDELSVCKKYPQGQKLKSNKNVHANLAAVTA